MSAVRCISAVLFLCGLAFAQAEWKIPQRNAAAVIEPRSVAVRYCQMDADGFRLDQEKARRMQEFTTWKTVPEVTRFDVISKMTMEPPRFDGDRFRATITYTVLGTYIMGAGYTAEPHTDVIDLELIQQDDGWKVNGSEELLVPHVQYSRAYRWFREQSALAKTAEAKAQLEDAANHLLQP